MSKTKNRIGCALLLGLTMLPLASARGDGIDLAIGGLNGISSLGHEGTFPEGASALTMPSTECNLGTIDISYRPPMDEAHPVLVMQLYRLKEDRFEQIGISDARHEYSALPSGQCSNCSAQSDGTFLPPACSNTSGASVNGDRFFLAPRDEVDPFTGLWNCEGSLFSGGQQDCVRRYDGSGLGLLDHRLVAYDSDLGQPGAEYFYEMYFLTGSDVDHGNNLGSRPCTMTWAGSRWLFATPSGQALQIGPALSRWGGNQSWATFPGDGSLLVASKSWDLGGGWTHFEYAVFNLDSARRARSFSVPFGSASLDGIGFHDADQDASNDWTVELTDGRLIWFTESEDQNPDAPALAYGLLYNFRFDAQAPSALGSARLLAWRTNGEDEADASAYVPSATTGVAGLADLRIAVYPNPTAGSADLFLGEETAGTASAGIYDASGRLLWSYREAFPIGARWLHWDGRDEAGRRVGTGVYYVRVQTPAGTAIRSLTVVR